MRDAVRAPSGRAWMVGVLLAGAAALAGIAMLLGAARAERRRPAGGTWWCSPPAPDDVSVTPDATLPAGATDVTLRSAGRRSRPQAPT